MSAPPKAQRERTAPPQTLPDVNAPLIGQELAQTVQCADALTERCRRELSVETITPLYRSMVIARTVELLDPVMEVFRPWLLRLQGRRQGFKSDKTYGWDDVKRCAIDALMKGAYLAGNEFNIIADECYLTKEHYERRVRELTTDLSIDPGTPTVSGSQVLLRVTATWRFNGFRQRLAAPDGKSGRVFSVISRSGATADNLIGKALRKAYKAIFERITGTETTEDDDFPDDGATNNAAPALAPPTRTDAVAAKLTNGAHLSEELQNRLAEEGRRVGLSETGWGKLLAEFGAPVLSKLNPDKAQAILDRLGQEPDARQPGDEG